MKKILLTWMLALVLISPVIAADDSATGENDANGLVTDMAAPEATPAPGETGVANVTDENRQKEFSTAIHEVIAELKGEIEGLDPEEKAALKRALNQGVEVDVDHQFDPGAVGVWIPILAISLSLGGPIIIVGLVLYASYRKRKQRLEMIDRFIDNNREIPQEILDNLDGVGEVKNNLRSGLTLMGVGLGVILGLGILAGWEVGALGLIPFFIGLARLLIWKLEEKQA